MNSTYLYQGSELDVFENAIYWRKYWQSIILKYISGNVLEVGAGTGNVTLSIPSECFTSWHALEPDKLLLTQLKNKIPPNLSYKYFLQEGTIEDVDTSRSYNTILYIDVLEHIGNDKIELRNSCEYLEKNGYLVTLVPAHNFLYSQFDKSIGHYRRYNKKLLLSVVPKKLDCIFCGYLDSVGMLLSLGNKLLLHSSQPQKSQILFWDKYVIPFSKIIDTISNYTVGKTLIGVWKK